jgi:hypothetical protein
MLEVDDSDLVHLTRAISRLPQDIKVKAVARAMRRVTEMARSRLVKRQSPRIKIPQGLIRKLTEAHFNAGGNTQEIIVRSGWIPLYKLGASQTRQGVTVKLRGSYRHAFLATMKSGHRGVFLRRDADKRLPIRELFGPNPAHDITNNPDVYQAVVAEVVQEVLLPRFLHELGRILPD